MDWKRLVRTARRNPFLSQRLTDHRNVSGTCFDNEPLRLSDISTFVPRLAPGLQQRASCEYTDASGEYTRPQPREDTRGNSHNDEYGEAPHRLFQFDSSGEYPSVSMSTPASMPDKTPMSVPGCTRPKLHARALVGVLTIISDAPPSRAFDSDWVLQRVNDHSSASPRRTHMNIHLPIRWRVRANLGVF